MGNSNPTKPAANQDTEIDPTVQCAVTAAIRYIDKRRDRMHYAEARAQGLAIGSGAVESTCKSLVNMRLKRPGSRWHQRTGDHILNLRALVLSDRWSAGIRKALTPLRKPVKSIDRSEAIAA